MMQHNALGRAGVETYASNVAEYCPDIVLG